MDNAPLSCVAMSNRKSFDTHDMLDDALALASVGVAALKMLESLLPSAASNVEQATKSLADHFMKLADSSSAQKKLAQDLLEKVRRLSANEAEVSELEQRAELYSRTMQDAIMNVVMTMQFQDRNTQITDNAARILQQYGTMLADIRDRITIARAGEGSVDAGVSQAARAILAGICIGDIRKHFIDALAEVNLQYAAGQSPQSSDFVRHDTVELF